MKSPQALLFAHRGARLLAPENTIEAFERAQKLGASALETDLWRTSDDVVICHHDGAIRQFLRSKALRTFAHDVLPKTIPSIQDVFKTCGVDVDYSFDVKDRDALEEIITETRRLFSEQGGDEQRLWFCYEDENFENLARCKTAAGSANMVQSTRLTRIKEGPEKRASRLSEMGVEVINMHISDWSLGLVTLFRRFNIKCFGYGAHHERELVEARQYQLDGVFSDDVVKMLQIFA